ncbi:MAG TPA: hypothetical protein VKT82_11690 [Ktedonobacterales bacterium]|nr:hypothetical protein [Ktedonobacterales bacterium]
METPVAKRPTGERPLLIVGIIGSCLAIASFFFLPLGTMDLGGPHPATSAWNLWQDSAAPPPHGSVVALILLGLLPGCALITLLIGGAALFRPLRRRWAHVFLLATLIGLCLLGLSFCTVFAVMRPQWGYLGMIGGYIGILIGRSGL